MASTSILPQLIDVFLENESTIKLQRRENLLLTHPPPPVKLWGTYEPLAVAYYAQSFAAAKYSPPRDVFTVDCLRLGWQQIDSRQPCYHRNADVDEISYHVDRERISMTDLGTVELRPGDFSRIPVGIAHDNYGRKQVHLTLSSFWYTYRFPTIAVRFW